MAETPSGMLNSIGLQNPGVDAFLEHDLPWLASHGARAIVSIAGGAVDHYAALAPGLERLPASLPMRNKSRPKKPGWKRRRWPRRPSKSKR